MRVKDASQEQPRSVALYHAGANGGQSVRLRLGLPAASIARGARGSPRSRAAPWSGWDLIAEGKDTPLLRVVSLQKSCQALGSALAA